jgi:hypothetical protein
MAERTNIPEIKEEEGSQLYRLFTAEAPKIGAPLTVPITLQPIDADVSITKSFIASQQDAGVTDCIVIRTNLPNRIDSVVAFVTPLSANTALLQSSCEALLHRYLVPTLIHSLDSFPASNDDSTANSPLNVDMAALEAMALPIFLQLNVVKPRTDMESVIEEIWRDQLSSNTMVLVIREITDFEVVLIAYICFIINRRLAFKKAFSTLAAIL